MAMRWVEDERGRMREEEYEAVAVEDWPRYLPRVPTEILSLIHI